MASLLLLVGPYIGRSRECRRATCNRASPPVGIVCPLTAPLLPSPSPCGGCPGTAGVAMAVSTPSAPTVAAGTPVGTVGAVEGTSGTPLGRASL